MVASVSWGLPLECSWGQVGRCGELGTLIVAKSYLLFIFPMSRTYPPHTIVSSRNDTKKLAQILPLCFLFSFWLLPLKECCFLGGWHLWLFLDLCKKLHLILWAFYVHREISSLRNWKQLSCDTDVLLLCKYPDNSIAYRNCLPCLLLLQLQMNR